MDNSSETIAIEIDNYINGCTGKYYSDFYVGISNDPTDRLFSDHKVDQKNGCWKYLKAIDIENARDAEKILLQKGMKGGDVGGDETSVNVYCYQITPNTKNRKEMTSSQRKNK